MAPRTKSPLDESKPSISDKSWFKVCSLSSLPPPYLESLLLPIASISSINIIHGACSCACLKRSLTLDAPTPTNISTKSEPLREKNGTFASPATALARSVLPVPGGPTSSAPLGSLAPILENLVGSCKKSTISVRDSFASSSPATSLKLTPVAFCTYTFALLRPTPIIPPPPIRFIIKLRRKRTNTNGSIKLATEYIILVVSCLCLVISTSAAYNLLISSGSLSILTV